jgi:hypothetical protein
MLNHDELVLFLISARTVDNLAATFERIKLLAWQDRFIPHPLEFMLTFDAT